MKSNKLINILLLSLSVLPMTAQTRQLSFEECVSMALTENVRIKTAHNNISSAQLQKKEAFTNYLPSVSLSGTGIAANEHLVQIPLQFPPEIPLPPQNIELVKSGVVAGVTAMLPIYAGGQIYYGNKLAKVGVEVEKLRMVQTENELRKTVAQYYWQIVMLQDKVKTLDAVDKQLASIYSDAEAAYNVGVATRNDVLQVDLKKNEIESLRLELVSNIGVLKMLLAQFIGVEDYSSLELSGSSDNRTLTSPETIAVNPDNALLSTAEYRLLQKNVEAAGIKKRMTLGGFLPKVAIGGGYFYNNLLDRSQNSLIGMVTVSIPISWKAGYSMRRQKLAVQNAEMQLDDNSHLLAIGIAKAYSDLDVAFSNIGIARKSIEQSQENLRMHEDFYQAGTSTMSDLLDAQTLYRQSCDRYTEAVSTYEIKKVEYMIMTGR